MIICISGTPGTGKTTLSKKIAKELRFKYVDGNEIIKNYRLSEGYDKKKDCMIIDAYKFSAATIKECEGNMDYIVDSHLSHFLPKNKVSLCIICRCTLKLLQKRLKRRRYSIDKIRENLDAEIFEVCLSQANEYGHVVYEFKNTIKNYIALIKLIKKIQKA